MSNTAKAFTKGKAFIPFITCGDPDLETTAEIVREMIRNGADLIELGIPFSDPTAEGPVIQAASERALRSGVTTDKILDFAMDIRKETDIPLAFMTYANVIFTYGIQKFADRCAKIGMDAVILPDVPFEEREEFMNIFDDSGIDLISLIAPTSKKRTSMIAREAKGFVYIVSSLGVTGERKSLGVNIRSMVDIIKEHTDIPCAVGFGISTPEQAQEICQYADGVIVGSSIVKLVAEYGKDSPGYIGAYVKKMKDAANSVSG